MNEQYMLVICLSPGNIIIKDLPKSNSSSYIDLGVCYKVLKRMTHSEIRILYEKK